MQKNYELIEHTADIGIRVKGGDLKELFKNSALAMFDIIAQKKGQGTRHKPQVKKIVIRQKADNLDELLVNWLNELLSLSSAKELIFCDFRIDKMTDNKLEARVCGQGFQDYKVNVEIKAATYHQLKIEQKGSLWQAEVIFDV